MVLPRGNAPGVATTAAGAGVETTAGVATAPLLDRYRGAPRPVNLGWTNFSMLKVLSMLEHGANGSGWKMVGNDGPNTFILHRNDP